MAKRRKKKPKKVTGCTKIEMVVAKILDEFAVPYKQNAAIGQYTVDFLVNDNTIIECYGDFWHANPTYYTFDYYNKALKMTAQSKWSKDANRQHLLESQGYKFYQLWETDLKKRLYFVRHIIKTIINSSQQ